MLRLLITVFAILWLSSCAAPPLRGNVTRFHVLDSSPHTFVVMPSEDQADSLEFRSYASLLSEQLASRGWQPTSFADADVAVFLQYQISQGQRVAFSYPIFGQVPTGSSTTSGTVSTYGNTSTFNATTRQNSTTGVVGTGTGSRVEYDRAIQLTIYSASAYRETKRMERLYEGTMRSSGSTGDLATVMPALVRGLLLDFPGKSGTTRAVSLRIR